MIATTKRRLPDKRRYRNYHVQPERAHRGLLGPDAERCNDEKRSRAREPQQAAPPADLHEIRVQILRRIAKSLQHVNVRLFLADVYEESGSDNLHKASDTIFDFFLPNIKKQEFPSCNLALSEIKVERLNPTQIVAILSATFMAKGELEKRGEFFRRAWEAIVRDRGEAKAAFAQ